MLFFLFAFNKITNSMDLLRLHEFFSVILHYLLYFSFAKTTEKCCIMST